MVFLIPETSDGDGDFFIKEAKALKGNVFLTINKGFCNFTSPLCYKKSYKAKPGPYHGKIHFVIFQNDTASKLDPIDIKALRNDISKWAVKHHCENGVKYHCPIQN